ncbi:hypothetical protein OG21DRAFT_1590310 [Imleria badia]|nr:hypothetical protein OG21DRAFT_1590310 [Imleria badia]
MTSFASFALLSLRNIGVPSTKIPIDSTTFVLYVLPPLVCYILVAVLAVTPHTRTARVVLWPLVALLALRAGLSVDMSLGKTERKLNNIGLVILMISVAARTLDWTLAKGPLVRHLRPANSSPSTVMDALDLAANLRGHGWEWSPYRSYIPRETRPANRIAFVFCAFLSAVAHALICVGVGPIPELEGSTIFDETLLFPLRYLRATIITTLWFTTYAPYLPFLSLDSAQWPPAFNAPLLATSLSAFWGRRWHRFFRRIFLLSGYPLSPVLGRAGILIGTFFASAVFHHIVLITLNRQTEFWRMLVGFGMIPPAILAEVTFHQLTGKRVGGVVGWVWTMAWLTLSANVVIEGFARAGMAGCTSPFDSALPMRIPRTFGERFRHLVVCHPPLQIWILGSGGDTLNVVPHNRKTWT